MAEVSIIMPAYNAVGTIADSIFSVQQQTYQDWELLITNDCSTDDTAALIKEIATKDPRVKLLEHETNQRAFGARNTSIQAASGRYLAFLDSDDLWTPQKLANSLTFMRDHNASFIFTAFTRFDTDPSKIESHVQVPAHVTYWKLLGDNVIATSTVVIDRSIHTDIVMPESYYDDFACWLSLLKGGAIARGINEPMMRYRKTQGSLSRNKFKSAQKVWYAFCHEQQLSLPQSVFHFARYMWNGMFKHYLTGLYGLKIRG